MRDASDGIVYRRAMKAYLIVFLGAGVGGMLRHGVNNACARLCGLEFPWGVLIINVLGSTIMGLLAGYFAFRIAEPWSQSARLFAMTGVLGGFTTFSAFSLDAVLLWERGAHVSAMLYVVGSVALAILGLVLGMAAVRVAT